MSDQLYDAWSDACDRVRELEQQLAGKETEVLHLAGKVLLMEQQLAEAEDFCKGEMERSAERNAKLRQQLAAKQAEVDALMLEYCPSEMSQEQLDNWAAHQRPAKEQGE